MAAILSLIAAIAAALIARSVMVSNHRQAWINGLRDDLAAFFTAIDVVTFKMSALIREDEQATHEERQRARNAVLLAHRKILMRLNMNEPLHQELEQSLGALLSAHGQSVDQDRVEAAVTLARVILKREWEVTKYGSFAAPMIAFKAWRSSVKRDVN
jgi:hypothetical protein